MHTHSKSCLHLNPWVGQQGPQKHSKNLALTFISIGVLSQRWQGELAAMTILSK
ncbi:MAG: hypothetical protein HOL72_07335 [Euryarchaeota archaeon]|nr:hypothetical protein [Euryarchaeota archaeon]